MKMTKISFEKLINTGHYSNEKYFVEFDLDENDNPQDVITAAKAFIQKQINAPSENEREIVEKGKQFDAELPF